MSFNPRRQSSISYYPSDHTPHWDLRSPTTASSSFLKRSTSLGHQANVAGAKGDRRSAGSVDAIQQHSTERGPLTLTEKHADLLRFIAQKESKCLDLRSQLAVHEAELAQLKRKWERIVSRGMDRAYSAAPAPAARNSSILTNTTASSVRLSQSSASSLAFDDPPHEQDERRERAGDEDADGCKVDSAVELSPASALKAARLHRRKSRDHPPVPALSLNTSSARRPSLPTVERSAKRSSLRNSTGLPPRGEEVGGDPERRDVYKEPETRLAPALRRLPVDILRALLPPAAFVLRLCLFKPLRSHRITLSTSPFTPSSAQVSLLEDDDDGAALGSVMVPDAKAPVASPRETDDLLINPAVIDRAELRSEMYDPTLISELKALLFCVLELGNFLASTFNKEAQLT
ncbi:hypothetical protein A0H81_02425 [Grifola frondosa]|uniref:Uncharacterized protein n=1 Tax=Grifola frondosa TaxID=5627 RepID=A0A1C7MS02_GRIFR|nr:hypothetical protein A0H81_02425 [Grifola frondosa]